jgi:hypothetical protein
MQCYTVVQFDLSQLRSANYNHTWHDKRATIPVTFLK